MSDLPRRYTFKLYPNQAQSADLESHRRLHSALYNALIEQRIDAYRRGDAYERALGKKQGKGGGVTLTAFDQGMEITKLRAEMPEYAALSRGSLEQTAKRVELAFQAFYRRAKAGAGAQSGFPKFKRCDSFGMREMNRGGWRFIDNRLTLQGIPGRIRARGKFPACPRELRTCELMLRAGIWWLSVVAVMPRRMEARQDLSGEVAFNLVDSFACVRHVDGGCAAGPEETVYAAADGRISLSSKEVTGEAPAATSESRGNRRKDHSFSIFSYPAATSESRGNRRAWSGASAYRAPAATSEKRGNRRDGLLLSPAEAPAATGDTRGDRRGTALRCRSPHPAATGDQQGNRRVRTRAIVPLPPAATCDQQGNSRERRESLATLNPAATSDKQGNRRTGRILGRMGSPAATDETKRIHRTDELRQKMSRCRRGSYRYRQLRLRLARLCARQANQRREALHVWTTRLVRRFAALRIIKPPLPEITESGHGNERDWGAAVALKAQFNRRLLDQSAGAAIAMLEYKIVERDGTATVDIDPDPVAAAGNLIVAATKANRKLKRTIRHAPRAR
jgi:transposase